ncbi:MAG: imelysin family protein [Rhodobacteraceae bacterium]|nr:imelysin family protein [Paracoccaceae bacterium]
MLRLLVALILLGPMSATADEKSDMIATIVNDHIINGFSDLATETQVLKHAAYANCSADSAELRAVWHQAFDAWIAVSHLRFGPSEINDRAFALAFWPDTRGFTPRRLQTLIEDQDAIVNSLMEFDKVSIAARGFYALEFLLYDPRISALGNVAYRCSLVQVVAADIAANADAILTDWTNSYAAKLRTVSGIYRTQDEALQELFKALITGLQFTSDTRLGRPMGSLEHPRPNRAEAWRSGRSVHNVVVSLTALRELALLLSGPTPELSQRFVIAFDKSLKKIGQLNDPVFANVVTTHGRFRVEALQQSVTDIRALAVSHLGPTLGVAAGFNALDGD